MADPRTAATARYHLLTTVCTCADRTCACHDARRRSDGLVHCPLCRTSAPTLKIAVRGTDLRLTCDAGCDTGRLFDLALADDTPLLALYGQQISPEHGRLLLDSAVAPYVAEARGYATVARASVLERLGFGKNQRNVPALLIPVKSVHGETATYQARPNQPRIKDGKPLKYETPAGSKMALDVPPAVRRDLGNPNIPLFITEGARKADAGASAGLCCIALLGVWNWRGTNEWSGKTALPDWELVALKDGANVGRAVFITFDSDAMTKSSVYLALSRLKPFLESRGATVRAIYLPASADGSKVGLDDFLADGNTVDDLLMLATETLREPSHEGGVDGGDRESQADGLVRIGAAGTLFTDAMGDGYARIQVDGHLECWPVRSVGFRYWLTGAYYAETGRAANNEAISTALNVLAAKARFGGAVESVYVRVAPDGDSGLYLDMGDPSWRAIHVTGEGWRIVSDPPVHFIRARGALPLPEPVAGGVIDGLRTFVNVGSDDWPLLKAFLRGCLNPRGPYPVLALNGEQGSAKSTTARMLRSLIDPRQPDLRSEPHDIRDLAIAARGSWLVAFDNISYLPQWLSDALCRLATGGGFATRALYSDLDETLFDAIRPTILTGISDYVVRDDLLDRTIQVTLGTIPDDRRRPEKVLWAALEAARPRLLGALLDDVSAALRTLPSVQLQRLPRMADFALWAVAAERGRDEASAFMAAYTRARIAGHEQALEASVIGGALLAFIAEDLAHEPWVGTAGDLLARLVVLGGERATRQKGWPSSPRGLSGLLRTLAPALRAVGVAVTFTGPSGKQRSRLIRLTRTDTPPPTNGGAQPSASSAPSAGDNPQEETEPEAADGQPPEADDWPEAADGFQHTADGCSGEADGADGCSAPVSVGGGAPDRDDFEAF